jgi:ATP-dependent helicase/nuclease subunit A
MYHNSDKGRIVFGESNLIQASAGSGKTYALSGQYIALLLLGEDPASILASTFTRKAAAEIQERVFIRLIKALNDPSDLQQQLKQIEINPEKILKVLNTLIANMHRLKISTLDGFQSSLTKLFAEELQLPLGWQIVPESKYRKLLAQAVSNLCSEIDPEQMSFLLSTLKRGNLSHSVNSSILSSLDFAVNDSDLSAKELWDWLKPIDAPSLASLNYIKKLSEVSLPLTKSGTTDKRFEIAVTNLIKLIQNSEVEKLLDHGIVQAMVCGNATYYKIQIPDALARLAIEIFESASKICLNSLSRANKTAQVLIHGLIAEIESIENSSGFLSFSSITKKLLKLSNSLFSDELYFRLDSKIKHLLLDEFQDTSLSQWQLLKPLIYEKLSDCSDSGSFFCVGDSKQSIYGWRGANSDVFDLIPKTWPDLNIGRLDTSYRSAPAIIEFVNALFASLLQNPSLEEFQPSAEKWLRKFTPHSTSLKSSPDSNVHFETIEADFDSEEYLTTVFAKILSWLKNKPGASIAILARNNDELSVLSEFAKSKGIELSSSGGKALDEFPIVNSVLALLSLILNSEDSISRFFLSSSAICTETSVDTLIIKTKESLFMKGLALTLQELSLPLYPMLSPFDKIALNSLIRLACEHTPIYVISDLKDFIKIAQSNKLEALSPSTIQAMTIHKSKGLEFDLVVLPNLGFSLKPDDKFKILKEEDPRTLLPIRASMPGSQALRQACPELLAMSQKARERGFEEALNLLYVAVTRPKTDLLLFATNKALESKSLTAAKLCAAVLQTSSSEKVSLVPDKQPQVPSEETSSQIKFQNLLSDQRLRGLSTTSASSQNQVQDQSRQIYIGLIMHSFFASTKYLEDVPAAESLRLIANSICSDPEIVQYSIDKFHSFIAQPNVVAVLKRDPEQNLEIYTEKPFVFREGSKLLQGRIDRIIISDKQALIIDYKLGSMPLPDSEKMYSFKKQIRLYKKAAQLLFPVKEISAQIIFLADGKVLDL